MSQEAEPIQLGIEMAKRAIEYDNGHKYSMAIMCYDLALDYFHKAQTGETWLHWWLIALLRNTLQYV
jgi:hypothetical protein